VLKTVRNDGFTLIEMLVTVVILAILTTIAAPSFRNYLLTLQIRSAAESILNGVQLARAEAIRRNAPIQFVLGTDGAGYSRAWLVQTAGGGAIQSRAAGESSTAVLISVVPDSAKTITFDGLGRRTTNSDASNPVKVINVDVPTSIMSAAASPDLRIVVLSGGLIKMCDPNISSDSDPRYCPCDPSITDPSDARYCS